MFKNLFTTLIFSFCSAFSAEMFKQDDINGKFYNQEPVIITKVYESSNGYSHLIPLLKSSNVDKLYTIYNKEVTTEYSVEEACEILARGRPNLTTLISQENATYDWDVLFKNAPRLARDGWFYSNPLLLSFAHDDLHVAVINLK